MSQKICGLALLVILVVLQSAVPLIVITVGDISSVGWFIGALLIFAGMAIPVGAVIGGAAL